MKEKGFTLIELLAVIVILAIIALIAVPIILNIIEDAREESNERSVELYGTAVKNAIARYQIGSAGTELTGTYESNEDGTQLTNKADESIKLKVDYDGSKVSCETIEIREKGDVYLGECKVNDKETNYTYGENQENGISKTCTIAKQNSNKYSVGDEVTCNIESTPDKFYVIEEANLNASTINMLTEKEISTTTYRQVTPINAGAVSFENTTSVVNNYVNYLNTKLTGATGSLLTHSQATNLGCTSFNCNLAPNWVSSGSYWLGTRIDVNNDGFEDNVWFISVYYMYYNDGTINNEFGVRPVITISTKDIQR